MSSCGSLLNLSRTTCNNVLHLYSPESETEDSHLLGEIEVFMLEYGLKQIHTSQRLYACTEFMSTITEFIKQHRKPTFKTLTVVFWGHGDRVDDSSGYLKIFDSLNIPHYLFIDDILIDLLKLVEQHDLKIQFLMTQCWAHCHNIELHVGSLKLAVDWFTSPDNPETSARRWDSQQTGREMIQKDFDQFMSSDFNYSMVESSTKKKYQNSTQCIYLKYLHHASIHLEATMYISNQR